MIGGNTIKLICNADKGELDDGSGASVEAVHETELDTDLALIQELYLPQ